MSHIEVLDFHSMPQNFVCCNKVHLVHCCLWSEQYAVVHWLLQECSSNKILWCFMQSISHN